MQRTGYVLYTAITDTEDTAITGDTEDTNVTWDTAFILAHWEYR